jgi:hypothetical protein
VPQADFFHHKSTMTAVADNPPPTRDNDHASIAEQPTGSTEGCAAKLPSFEWFGAKCLYLNTLQRIGGD